MSATTLLGVPRIILLGGAIVMLMAATAFTLKITQPKITLPRAAAAAPPVHPVDPAILHGFLQRGRDEMALP